MWLTYFRIILQKAYLPNGSNEMNNNIFQNTLFKHYNRNHKVIFKLRPYTTPDL